MPAAQADTVMRIFSPVPRTASAMVSLRTDWGTSLPWPLQVPRQPAIIRY
jgi:hypothetical protein